MFRIEAGGGSVNGSAAADTATVANFCIGGGAAANQSTGVNI
jgi:hypothetical protein